MTTNVLSMKLCGIIEIVLIPFIVMMVARDKFKKIAYVLGIVKTGQTKGNMSNCAHFWAYTECAYNPILLRN